MSIVEQFYKLQAEAEDLLVRAEREKADSGEVSEETEAALLALPEKGVNLLDELGSWHERLQSKKLKLEGQYKPILERIHSDFEEVDSSIDFCKKLMAKIFGESEDGEYVSERVRLYYRVTPKVLVFDEAQIPKQFMRVTESPDKKALKEALEDEQEIPGAELKKSFSLQVKPGGEKALKNARKRQKTLEAKKELQDGAST